MSSSASTEPSLSKNAPLDKVQISILPTGASHESKSHEGNHKNITTGFPKSSECQNGFFVFFDNTYWKHILRRSAFPLALSLALALSVPVPLRCDDPATSGGEQKMMRWNHAYTAVVISVRRASTRYMRRIHACHMRRRIHACLTHTRELHQCRACVH